MPERGLDGEVLGRDGHGRREYGVSAGMFYLERISREIVFCFAWLIEDHGGGGWVGEGEYSKGMSPRFEPAGLKEMTII